MELAGKYSNQATIQDVVALAKSYAPGKVLATGEPEDELVARLLPAAMNLGLDPVAVIKNVLSTK